MTKIMIMVTTENNDYQKDKKAQGKGGFDDNIDQELDRKLGGDGGCDNIDNDIDEEKKKEEDVE